MAVDDPHLLEINLCDLHFDRLVWGEESGNNWDMKISADVGIAAVDNLLKLTAPFPVGRILYVCGNDFFTADNPEGTTTAGTPQVVDGRWQKSFRRGIAMQHAVIERLRKRAPVDVMVVPGNHDNCRTFYLGEVIGAVYAGATDVRVFNSPQIRKYYRWGKTLIAFTHGDRIRLNALPLIMAGEAAKDWAETTSREIHCGHYHHKKEMNFNSGDEFGSVRVRILPALTSTDAWHAQMGFTGSLRASEAYLYSKARGYVGHLSWSPLQQREISVVRG
jgi:hypothetical protein